MELISGCGQVLKKFKNVTHTSFEIEILDLRIIVRREGKLAPAHLKIDRFSKVFERQRLTPGGDRYSRALLHLNHCGKEVVMKRHIYVYDVKTKAKCMSENVSSNVNPLPCPF